ncbi:MAG: dienelactone hydrolase family protein [Anaerolineae bacterium]|nr:dienelactone hydrolase family protein [Anaerolineae bacterium]
MADQHGQTVSFDVLGRTANGYLALPAGDSPGPGVVVIQEWWGLEDHIKDVTARFAEAGFVALAPDLYYGKVATEPDEARKLVMSLRQELDKALAAIQSAINLLLAHDRVSSTKIGVTGFCMGGGLAWHAAAKLQQVGASVPFYGGGSELSDAEVARITCPVLAIFGELDEGVSPEVAQARAAQMDRAGVMHETIIYPNAQHAFFNDTRPAYNPDAAADAWQRMLKLFKETLT